MSMDVKPPGRLALALGANGLVTCDCGSVAFHCLAKMTQTEELLVALKCMMCDKETPVPLDVNRAANNLTWDKELAKEIERKNKSGV